MLTVIKYKGGICYEEYQTMLAAVMAIAVLMCLALTVYALPGVDAGAYGYLSGLQMWANDSIDVTTSTKVTTNPDNAYLKATVEMLDVNGKEMATLARQSSTGATSFSTTHMFSDILASEPSCVWVAHEVKGGASEYVYYAKLEYTG